MNTFRKIRHAVAAYAFFAALNILFAIGDCIDWIILEVVSAVAIIGLWFAEWAEKHPRVDRTLESWVSKCGGLRD